jgi:hypothetical protein
VVKIWGKELNLKRGGGGESKFIEEYTPLVSNSHLFICVRLNYHQFQEGFFQSYLWLTEVLPMFALLLVVSNLV